MICSANSILVGISAGELIDRITILQIKSERMQEPEKVAHVREELAALLEIRSQYVPPLGEVDNLAGRLASANGLLWRIEDELRQYEAKRDFGSRFIRLARLVYRINDRRWKLKRRITEVVGSGPIEEKCYPAYGLMLPATGGLRPAVAELA